MAAQPVSDGLVAHELGVSMARPRQREYEEPGFKNLPGVHVGDQRAGAEIDLGRLCRFERQPHRHFRHVVDDELMEKAIHGGVAAGVAMIAHQRGVDGRALNAGGIPIADLRAPWLQRLDAGGGQRLLAHQRRGQNGIFG